MNYLHDNDFFKSFTAIENKYHWNFGVGVKGTDKDFDIFDNEYVEVTGMQYRNDNNSKGEYFKKVDLVRCKQSVNAPYLDQSDFNSWYPNSVCFPKNSETQMLGSWWYKKFI